MHFSIGQSIVHPVHGAGVIVNIEEEELVSGFTEYYVVEFRGKRLILRVPVRRVKELGMREVMSLKRFERVMHTLRQMPGSLPQNFNERRHAVIEMINSGFPTRIAEAVRELTWRQVRKDLTKSDRELLSEGRARLIAEMALATDRDPAETRQEIDAALTESMQAGESELKAAA